MSSRVNRRRFLQSTAAAGAGYWLTATARSAARAADGPNGKLRFAGVGAGGKGGSDISQAGHLGPVVALCDIDEGRLGQKAQEFPDAKKFTDFRRMLEELGNQIDAVTVGTPDHTHAPASVMAMKLGKHVYCQKPLTHTVHEARVMRETAKKMGVCTQMGNQGSASSGLRRAVEQVQAGILGPVREAHVWTNRPIWPQGADAILRVGAAHDAALAALHGKTAAPHPAEAPKGVHWDAFLGPAPYRPYDKIYHPFAWRGWWDFGTGALGDMACHTANRAFRALKLAHPTGVVADATGVNPETYPTAAKVTFQFPAREDMAAVKVTWYEGFRDGQKLAPPDALLRKVLNPGERLSNSGSMLVGDKGILFSPNDYGEQYRFIGAGVDEAAKAVPERLPRLYAASAAAPGQGRRRGGANTDQLMKEEWVRAIKENKPAIAYSNFDFAALLTETILLGNVAIRLTGQELQWDGPSLKFTNNSAANQYLHYEYRKGWTL